MLGDDVGEEESSMCEVSMDEKRLDHVLEFKQLGFVLDESGKDGEELCRKWQVR